MPQLRICLSNSRRSSEDEGDNESNTTADSGARGQEPHSATSSISGIMANLAGGVLNPSDLEHLEQLSKQSCYDSGIDIRDPIPNVQPIPKKTVYSDADIVLSSDWVPPKPITITPLGESPPRTSGLDAGAAIGARKKTTSVSFSVDDNNETQTAAQAQIQAEKNAADKKNKVNCLILYYGTTKITSLFVCFSLHIDVETFVISLDLGRGSNRRWRSSFGR